MAIRILGETRSIPEQIGYLPKAHTAKRQFSVSRAATSVGNTSYRPLILCDAGFWNASTYSGVINAIADSGMRVWDSTDDGARQARGGAAGIPTGRWADLRRVAIAFGDTEMIGAMMAILRYDGFMDLVVTAAPNILYNTSSKSFKSHTRGDNDGTQIHSEMVMAAQLEAFYEAITTSRREPVAITPGSVLANRRAAAPAAVMVPKPGQGQTARGGRGRRGAVASLETEEAMSIDVDLFIEKGSLCAGCAGTWDKIFTQPVPTNPPVKCQYRI